MDLHHDLRLWRDLDRDTVGEPKWLSPGRPGEDRRVLGGNLLAGQRPVERARRAVEASVGPGTFCQGSAAIGEHRDVVDDPPIPRYDMDRRDVSPGLDLRRIEDEAAELVERARRRQVGCSRRDINRRRVELERLGGDQVGRR